MRDEAQSKAIEWLACLAGLAFLVWVLAQPLQFAASLPKTDAQKRQSKGSQPKQRRGSKKEKVKGRKVPAHLARWAGSGKCRSCHPKIAQDFATTGKSRSILPLDSASTVEKSGKLVTTGLAQYVVSLTPGRMVHRESVKGQRGGILIDHAVQMRFAVGSGSLARAYLSETDGQFRVSPLAWRRDAPHWRLLPGYEVDDLRRFEAKLGQRCWSCHASRAATTDKVASSPFVAKAVNCESCHGPSADHVTDRQKASKKTISKSGHTRSRASRSGQACIGCHVSPSSRIAKSRYQLTDYHAGRPISDVLTVVNGPDNSPNPVAEMFASRCFQESLRQTTQMQCTTCHDPHKSHSGKSAVAHYRKSCQQCHEQKDKECKVSAIERKKTQPDDSCIACHMPRRTLSPQLASGFHGHGHDHRIVRHRAKPKVQSVLRFSVPNWWPQLTQAKLDEGVEQRAIALAKWGSIQPTLWFEKAIDQRAIRINDEAKSIRAALASILASTDLDIAVSQALSEIDLLSEQYASALRLLDQVVQANPTNARARALLAFAQWKSKQPATLATVNEALQLAPNRSGLLLLQARILHKNGDLTSAIKAAEKALVVNPRRWAVRRWLAEAYRASKNQAGERRQRAFLKRVGK